MRRRLNHRTRHSKRSTPSSNERAIKQTRVGQNGLGKTNRETFRQQNRGRFSNYTSSKPATIQTSGPSANIGALVQSIQNGVNFIDAVRTLNKIQPTLDGLYWSIDPGEKMDVLYNTTTGEFSSYNPDVPNIMPDMEKSKTIIKVRLSKPKYKVNKKVCEPPKKRFDRDAREGAVQNTGGIAMNYEPGGASSRVG